MVDAKVDGYQPNNYVDPSANLWSTYLSKSEKHHKAMAENWKGDMDAILIFAGLFLTSVTAFIVESYKNLSPDTGDTTVLLLIQISEQLAMLHPNNTVAASVPLPALPQQGFTPSLSALACNTLWFLSLSASLLCALSATLVKQWTRQYLQASNSRPAPQDRARLSTYLDGGIKHYQMPTIVEIIPMLLHTSLFLFFAGLVFFLIPINTSLQYLILAVLCFCCGLYFLVTILPMFDLCCPYWTPFSSVLWSLLVQLQLLYRRDADGNRVPILSHMSEAREKDATDTKPERDERDMKAMCWTISSLRGNHEFERFVEVIPDVVSGIDYSAKWLLDALMVHADINVRLGHRIPRLLTSCTSGLLEISVAEKRSITCLKSIWSLTMLSIPQPLNPNSRFEVFRDNLRFKEDTFDLFYNVRRAVPSVSEYIQSASVVIARSLLDMQLERADSMAVQLEDFLLTSGSLVSIPSLHINSPQSSKQDLLSALRHRMKIITEYTNEERPMTVPYPHVLTEAAAMLHHQLASVAMPSSGSIDPQFCEELLDCFRNFRIVLNQAGFNLALSYVAEMLESKSLPHEAFNTIRRTFFRVRFDLPLSAKSQETLVHHLDAATEQTASSSTRLPQSIIEIILGLTRALTEPNHIIKARKILEEHIQTMPSHAARSALDRFNDKVPQGPMLDLFALHVYADAKPIRRQSHSGVLPGSTGT
ncbi:hypothetical protein CPC08DRAFT_694480 [Agrocybe pediades]|nr:hypothetical protein CPC08DRAFT_694480 [Agrocybe pediades]